MQEVPKSENGVMASKEEARAQEVETINSGSEGSGHGPQHVSNENPYVHEHMNMELFLALTGMAFLWVGSQIPLYIFGGVLPRIYADIGGVDRYVWFVVGYLIPNAALCPFVGALSDMFGRRYVAICGQALLILGPIITATAQTMNIAIAGQVFSGLGAGLNELIALAATAEMVPIRKRGFYVGMIVFTILPFCPSVVYAQLIAEASNWRINGVLICVWNAVGLILVTFFYKEPPRVQDAATRRAIIKQIDYVGGFLSTVGVLCFMMGMQWGAEAYPWSSHNVLVPFILGIVLIIAFFVWEVKFAPYPMVPKAIFHKAKRTMIIILLITFLSGGNFFVLLLFWPTQIYNVYGFDPVQIGLRSLPIGFGIIGGAFVALVLIPVTKGRVTAIMIAFTALMTAGTGAICTSTPDNIAVMYVVVSLAAIGVGGVIIPSSIIAQIVCPTELIATITAITLSIRYIGGAIGYTAYYNVFYHKFVPVATQKVAIETIVFGGMVAPSETVFIEAVVNMLGTAQFVLLRETIMTSPLILRPDRQNCYDLIVRAGQEAFASAYRWPYWMSIAFGGSCFILAFFLGDIKQFLTEDVYAPPAKAGDAEVGLKAEQVQAVKAGKSEGH